MKKTRKNVGGGRPKKSRQYIKNVGKGRRKKTRKDKKKEGSAAERARLSAVERARQKAIDKSARKKARESFIKALSWPYYDEDNNLNSQGRALKETLARQERDISEEEKRRSATRKRKQRNKSLGNIVSLGNIFESSKKSSESSNRSKNNSVKRYDSRPRLQRPRSKKKPNNLITISQKDIELDRYLDPPGPDFSGLSRGRTLGNFERSEHQVTKPYTRAFKNY